MKIRKAIVFGDVHFPYADSKAIDIFFSVIKEERGITEVVALGDVFDCYSLSRFPKSPKKMARFIEDEFATARVFLHKLSTLFPSASKYFLCGNHESRLHRFIEDNCGILSNQVDIKSVLEIPHQWKFLPYGRGGHVTLGPVTYTHGVKCGIHACRNTLLKYQTNICMGHVHRNASYSFTNHAGKTIQGYTLGGLWSEEAVSDYQIDVIDGSKGFGICEYDSHSANLQIVAIENGKAIWNGKTYS